MSKKLLVAGVLMSLVAVMLVAGATTTSAQTMSLCQTVDALVLAGVIAPDKVVAAKAAAGCTAAPATAAFTRNLTVGSTGADVTALQTKLGVTPATGYFGAITKAAVMAYQTANGIAPVSGYVGPLTLAKLNAGVVVAPVTPVTPVTPVVSGLDGEAGSVTITTTSTDVENEVAEGASNVKVIGFKVEAEDSDVDVTSLKVSLKNTDGASSSRLDRYAEEVSIYMGSTKVGSADVADFTKTGTTYSKTIALDGAIVREGSSAKKTFYVTVSANSSIDSVNRASDDWAVLVENLRFVDGSGVTTTENTVTGSISAGTFDFTTLAASGDVKVVVSKGSSSPVAGNVEVSDTGSTNDVLVLEFKVKATGSDISFDAINITTTEGTASTLTEVVSQLVLKNGSNELATIDGADLDGTDTFDLDDTFTVEAGNTETFRIYADINDADNFTIADVVTGNLLVSFASFSPEDENGDTITDTGSAAGTVQTFIVTGAVVNYVSSTYTAPNDTDNIDGTITMKFTVEALGDNDVTIAEDQFGTTKTTGVASQTAGAGVVVYTLTGGSTSDGLITSTTLSKDGSDNFVVSAGSTETFTLSVKIVDNSVAGFVRLAISNVDATVVSNVVQTPAY